jgi:hypothetical protein
MADPDYFDARMAGWWAWGQSAWIGAGWCSGRGPWVVGADGRIARRTDGGGVHRKLPHVSDDGRGVAHANAREPGVGDYHPMIMPELTRWLRFLSARLRHVRILNGAWERACTSGALQSLPVRQGGHCGVFLDPPYDNAVRDAGLYTENGSNPRYRIVLAGFDAEHGDLARAGWREVEWFRKGFLKGGMAQQGEDGHQQGRERLWLSPHCLGATVSAQGSLFGGAA